MTESYDKARERRWDFAREWVQERGEQNPHLHEVLEPMPGLARTLAQNAMEAESRHLLETMVRLLDNPSNNIQNALWEVREMLKEMDKDPMEILRKQLKDDLDTLNALNPLVLPDGE